MKEARRRLKSEGRNPKAERRPKSESQTTDGQTPIRRPSFACRSALGFGISFGFRPSDFGIAWAGVGMTNAKSKLRLQQAICEQIIAIILNRSAAGSRRLEKKG